MTGGFVSRPVVYLGPSAPPDVIRSLIHDAVLRPPIRRGDLYRDRLLRFSTFLIVDGVFAQQDAIPPREVVDVIRDGATVLGAASMGALRATDCAPLGMKGIGHVHRLFRTGALNSEDEVAVIFDPDRPFPALSGSLVNMRVALRRAVRARRMSRTEADAVLRSAAALHFSRRGWSAAFRDAGLSNRWQDLRPFLKSIDIKRADTELAVRRLSAMPRMPGITGTGDSRDRPPLAQLALARRERGLSGLPEPRSSDDRLGFLLWMHASGRIRRYPYVGSATGGQNASDCLLDKLPYGSNCLSASEPVKGLDGMWKDLEHQLRVAGAFNGEYLRHLALALADGSATKPDAVRVRLAELKMAAEHGAEDWEALVRKTGHRANWYKWARDRIAGGSAWRAVEGKRPEGSNDSCTRFGGIRGYAR